MMLRLPFSDEALNELKSISVEFSINPPLEGIAAFSLKCITNDKGMEEFSEINAKIPRSPSLYSL